MYRTTEDKVKLYLIGVMVIIVIINAIGGYFYVQELEKRNYFLERTAERDNAYADLKKEQNR